jgi:DNA-binding Lrp family transcriptional regulator
MEEERIIRGYTTIIDPEYLDLYSLCIRISAKTGADPSAIGREIASFDRVYVVMRVSGDCDLLAGNV